MTIKKKLALLAILAVTVMAPTFMTEVSANAGTPSAVSESSEESYENLRLTDDQKQQIKPIMEQRVQDINQVMHDPSLTPDEKWAKADAIRKQSRANVDQYLTPEQKAKADPIRSENDEQRGKMREEQEKVIGDNKQLKEDRKQLHEDRKNGNKEAAEDDKDKVREDRQQRSNDRQDRHQVSKQGKEERRDRRQLNRG